MKTITPYMAIAKSMTDEQLHDEIKDFDFWGETDEYKTACHDELQERELQSKNIITDDSNKLISEIEYATQKMAIRSSIVAKLHKGTLYRVRNYDSGKLTDFDYKQLQSFADQLNSNESQLTTTNTITEQFISDFATSGYFLRDDVINIINSIENVKESQNTIATLTTDMNQQAADAIEYYEQIFTENEEKTSHFENCIDANEWMATAEPWNLETVQTETELSENTKELIEWFESQSVETTAEKIEAEEMGDKIGKEVILLYKDKKRSTSHKKRPILKSVSNLFRKVKNIVRSTLDIDRKSVVVMHEMMQKAPKQFKRAAKKTLDNLAYDTRIEYQKQVKTDLIVRNKGLPKKGTGYRPAVMASPDKMKSVVGSHTNAMDRFDGWGAQEGTAKATRKRLITDKGRISKNRKKRMTKKAKLNSKMANVAEIVGRSSQLNKTERVLAYLSRKGKDGKRQAAKYGSDNYFMTSKSLMGGRLPKGSYKITGGRLKNGRYFYKPKSERSGSQFETMQYTPGKLSKLQPKNRKMLQKATKRYRNSERPNKRFRYNMYREMEILNKR